MNHQVGHSRDNLGYAGLVVCSEKGVAVGDNQVFTDVRFQLGELADGRDDAFFLAEHDVCAVVVLDDSWFDVFAAAVGTRVHVSDESDGGDLSVGVGGQGGIDVAVGIHLHFGQAKCGQLVAQVGCQCQLLFGAGALRLVLFAALCVEADISQEPFFQFTIHNSKFRAVADSSFIIIVAHGKLDAAQRECFDSFAGHECLLVDDLFLFGAEAAEDEIHLCASREVVADAEAQPVVALSAERLGYVLQAVVPAVAASLPDAYRAEWQAEVIDHDQHVLYGYLLLQEPVADGVAGEVHIGRWLEQDQLCVLDAHVGHEAVPTVLKSSIGRLR